MSQSGVRTGPLPSGWQASQTSAGHWQAHLGDRARLTYVVEATDSTSMRGWQQELLQNLAATIDGWATVDTGPVSIGGVRCFHIIGTTTGPDPMIRHLWCTIRHRARRTVTLQANVRAYDAVVDDVVAAIAALPAED